MKTFPHGCDNWKWFDVCFSSCGRLNSEIDVNQWRIESPSRLSKVHVSIPRNAVPPLPCENYYACNACNFQMKLIHRFNRPISAPNFPQFPGNVPFCPRSPVPPPPIAPGSPSPWLLATPFHHEFVPAKNIHREITALSERREMEDREGESAYLFLMLTGGHVCGWRVACNQCARRV